MPSEEHFKVKQLMVGTTSRFGYYDALLNVANTYPQALMNL